MNEEEKTKQEVIDRLKGRITPKKRIHKVYQEFKKANKKLDEIGSKKIRQLIGKWQYIYSTRKGEISLVKFLDYLKEGDNFWEIYCLKGNLFKDCERFRTKENAEKRIVELLL